MAEVEAGCASTFMVKDHSRLGRNWLVVGILLYKEVLHLNQIIGILLCIAGLILINR